MSHLNYTTERRKNKHLTEKERYQIEILLKEKLKPIEIAKRLGRHVRTIQREIKRGTVKLLSSDLTHKKVYSADVGQKAYDTAAANKGPTFKIGHDHKLAKHIEKRL